MVKENPSYLLKLDLQLQNNQNFLLQCVTKNPAALGFALPLMQCNKEFTLECVTKNPAALKFALPLIKCDPYFILECIKKNPEPDIYIDYLVESLSENKAAFNDILIYVIKTNYFQMKFIIKYPSMLQEYSQLRNDPNFILKCVAHNPETLRFAAENLQTNPEFISACFNVNPKSEKYADKLQQAIIQDPNILEANPLWLENPYLMAECIKKNPDILSVYLFNNDFVLKCITEIPALVQLFPDLQCNPSFMEQCLAQAPSSIGYATKFVDYIEKTPKMLKSFPTLQNNPAFMLHMIKQDPSSLDYASQSLKEDCDFILKCIKANYKVYKYMDLKFTENHEVMAAVYAQDGLALEHASGVFLTNTHTSYKLIKIAVNQNGLALKFTGYNWSSNEYIVKLAVKQNGLALKFAGYNWSSNEYIVKLAVKQNGLALQYAHPTLQKDNAMIYLAYKTTPESVKLITKQQHKHLVENIAHNDKWTNERYENTMKLISNNPNHIYEILKNNHNYNPNNQ